ncbi:Rne/Rng family ribonuclease [Szabonella alba]|uniref:Ribonuclease E n=1 Tax=Szabonella alba TaxID=2804194 RepID=A0A8K0VD21_9RHOB|nr:ribonuclease E/G [Szabonella alba]MBL4917489.1 ribonuclease E/G [Szabonella alba]
MAKKMLIDATHAEETRVVVVDGNKVEEFDFETVNKRQLAGNIYLAKVTRVEPSLQAAFVDYGGNRHGFLAFAEIHPDYYQIPVADRKALLDEERAMARAEDEEERDGNRRRRPRPARAEQAKSNDETRSAEVGSMDVVDLGEEEDQGGPDLSLTTADTAASPEAETARKGTSRNADSRNGDSRNGDNGSEEEGKPYRAMDSASDTDDEIESVADEDVSEEIRAPRRPRARRYKIQEVVKVRQIMLVQVVKEERGNKGAALTTYLSLAGRYCVLMPNTARGGGISRKITQANDRKKLKEIASEIEVPEGAGLIIRTAGAKRTKPEIRRDYEYLMRLWEQIRELTLKSIAPAAIYEEGNLIKRSIRDLYSREIDEVLVEGAEGYRVAKDFMRMIMPSHAKAVQPYNDAVPLFARYQVESYLAGMFNPTVQLKSGGYIVIGITEALVAVDVNSGRATKEGSIEETALKTNLEAAEEVARQLRLRDLAGLIVIDFIDMEERRNNAAVEKRLKDKLKTDRARIQVGRISGFGLLEMSRQRLRPGMLESTTQPCAHCHGTGLIRSDDSMALTILRALEEEGTRKRSKEVLLRAPVAVVNFLMNQKREHIAMIEARYGMSVRIEADPAMISPDFTIEKFKTATRNVPELSAAISGNASLMGAAVDDIEDPDIPDEEEEDAAEVEAETTASAPREDAEGNGTGRKKRRRRRRRRSGSDENGNGENGSNGDDEGGEDEAEAGADVTPAAASAETPEEAAEEPKARRSRSRSSKSTGSKSRSAKSAEAEAETVAQAEVAASGANAAGVETAETAGSETAEAETAPKKTSRSASSRSRSSKSRSDKTEAAGTETAGAGEAAPEAEAEKPKRTRKPRSSKSATKADADAAQAATAEAGTEAGPVMAETAPAEPAPAPQPEPVAAAPKAEAEATETPADAEVTQAESNPEPAAEAEPDEASKPRRRGWWSLGR